jgi:hypothetical protein
VNIFHSAKYLLNLKIGLPNANIENCQQPISKNMRLFYENWNILDGNSSVATDELSYAINFGDGNQSQLNSSVATDDLQLIVNQVYCKINPIEDVAKLL